MQIKLWPKNEASLKKIVNQSNGLLTITKIANFAISVYATGINSQITNQIKPKKP